MIASGRAMTPESVGEIMARYTTEPAVSSLDGP